MKLSTILKTKKLNSATIHNHGSYVVAECFIYGKKRPIRKVYNSIDLDVSIPEVSNYSVKHLGIKKYHFLKTDKYYVNYYVY